MTLREACKKQLARLPGNLPGGPETANDKRSYINAFEKHARSEVHATMVIDSLIETCQFYPKIPDIVAMCGAIDAHAPTALALLAACGACKGDLWVVVVARGGSVGVARCSCERGRYLAARDRERAA